MTDIDYAAFGIDPAAFAIDGVHGTTAFIVGSDEDYHEIRHACIAAGGVAPVEAGMLCLHFVDTFTGPGQALAASAEMQRIILKWNELHANFHGMWDEQDHYSYEKFVFLRPLAQAQA